MIAFFHVTVMNLSSAPYRLSCVSNVDGDMFLCICLLEFHFIVATSSSYLLERVVIKLADRSVLMHASRGDGDLHDV